MRAMISSTGTSASGTPGTSVKQLGFLFSNFEGRLSRGVFWWSVSLMMAAQVALTAAIARTIGLGWRDFAFAERRALWVNLVVIAFFFWPSLALCIKRLHDRDLPGWWAALLHVLMFIVYIEQVAARPMMRDQATIMISLIPIAMLFLVGSWLVIELAFLSGTPGPNRFGPAPSDIPLKGSGPSGH